MDSDLLLVDNYTGIRAGAPYRLLPFGALVKNGRRREITPEVARQFQLPHFKSPIKLGSHADVTPAGGFIVGLEVRDDGLYAIPEYTEKGEKALADGDYRYHSPEIIWEGGGLEDPTTGAIIPGPLIVGDALLHTPHLGEAAALYSIEEVTMTDETVQVPKTFWETFNAWFKKATEPPEDVTPAVDVEQMTAIQAERDEYKARLDALEADAARKARVDAFAARLAETKAEPAADMLAGMTDEQAEWVLAQFSALSAQINDAALLGELGTTNAGDENDDPKQRVMRRAQEIAAEKKIDFGAAILQVEPDLLAAAYPVRK